MLNKYYLYENSVQTPEVSLDIFEKIFKETFEKTPHHFREDFCGTFWLSSEWVKRDKNHTALAIDLDPEPLEYGKKRHFSRLKPDQQSRLRVHQGNVLTPPPRKSDLIAVGNFSFNIFKDKPSLVNYFRSVHQSLKKEGLFVLEMAGGPGMITHSREQKSIRITKKRKIFYYWDQQLFDPITHYAQYAIHFRIPGEKIQKNVFFYDWRLWTIPELREALKEAGFSNTFVYWETAHNGKGTGEYVRTENGDNAYAWIAFVAATP